MVDVLAEYDGLGKWVGGIEVFHDPVRHQFGSLIENEDTIREAEAAAAEAKAKEAAAKKEADAKAKADAPKADKVEESPKGSGDDSAKKED